MDLLVDKCLYSHLKKEMLKDDPEIQTLLDQAEESYTLIFLAER